MSYFKDGRVELEGRAILFTKEEAAQYENAGNYWHENYMRWHDGDDSYSVF